MGWNRGRKEKMEREFFEGLEGSGREQSERGKQKGEKWEVIEGRASKGNGQRFQ